LQNLKQRRRALGQTCRQFWSSATESNPGIGYRLGTVGSGRG
jgi:hypothetical protein